ncbi:hypothetical protein [Microbacterium sp.]|uniref:hypothetical protein n=1 Tax=Microbacterium sp. TaxID=51671 RepID=UPI003A8F61A3
MNRQRSRATAILAPLLLVPLLLMSAGCTSEIHAGLSSMDACRAADTLSLTPADDPEALTEATIALASELPEELQPAALLLSEPPTLSLASDRTDAVSVDVGAVDAHTQERLQALLDVQTWVMAACGSYVTIGAPPDAGLAPADAHLADFETVVGEDSGEVFVSVLGINSAGIALELCTQALTEYEAEGSVVYVQVLDPAGRVLASADREAGESGGACTSPVTG